MIDEWVLVPDWNNYEVTRDGRIRRSLGGRGTRSGRLLHPGVGKRGYLTVTLTMDGKSKNAYVHKLVASAFIGPADGRDVNHKGSEDFR